MRRSRVVLLAVAVALYALYQYARVQMDYDFQHFAEDYSPEAARSQRMFVGDYRIQCQEGVPAPTKVYALRPFKRELGPLMVGSRTVVPDAVSVIVDPTDDLGGSPLQSWRASVNEALYLTFEDNAGVRLSPDGQTAPIEATGDRAYGPGSDNCCTSSRARAPERFWLTGRDGTRLCEFTFDEATRADAPPRTSWAW